ncbi:MAG: DUF4340 domain-containing protein [Planctomycetota bacterium]
MKRNLVLLALLAVLVALDLATAPRTASRAASGRVFAQLETDQVARIVVDAPGAEALAIERVEREGESVWVLPAQLDFQADRWLVDTLLGSLERVAEADLVAEAPSDPADFGLAEGVGVRVRVLDAEGRSLADYRQGEQLARAGGIEGVYLTRSDGPAVYRAPLVPRLAVDVESWLATRVAGLDLAGLRALGLEVAGERTLPFERSVGGRWSGPTDDEAPEVALDRLATATGELFLSGVVSDGVLPEHGFDPPRIVVELELADPIDEEQRQVVRMAVGADVERDDGVRVTYVTWSAWPRPWVVEVRSALLERLFEAVLEVFAAAVLEDE